MKACSTQTSLCPCLCPQTCLCLCLCPYPFLSTLSKNNPRREFQKGGGKGKGKGKFEGEGEGKGRALNRYCGLFTDQGALEHLRAPQIVEMDDSNDPTGFIGDHQGSDLLLLHQVKCLDCQFPRSYRDRSWGHAF